MLNRDRDISACARSRNEQELLQLFRTKYAGFIPNLNLLKLASHTMHVILFRTKYDDILDKSKPISINGSLANSMVLWSVSKCADGSMKCTIFTFGMFHVVTQSFVRRQKEFSM